MIKVGVGNGTRDAFEQICETISISKNDQGYTVYRFVNGGESHYPKYSFEEIINELNEEGWFISGIDSKNEITYMSYITLFAD